MPNRRNKLHLKPAFKLFCAVLAVLLVAVSAFAINKKFSPKPSVEGNNFSSSDLPVSSEEREPISVTLGCTGDLIIHTPMLQAYAASNYDFNDMFRYVNPYFSKYDYMVANLETTLAGTNHSYTGYPIFNTPDTIVDTVLNNGIDMLITANNHSYDTGKIGFDRTVQVLTEKHIDHTGTRAVPDKPYLVKDVNGIKFGMINYTYETARSKSGRKTLNGIPLREESEVLINSFNYNDLEAFYTELAANMESMKSDGAEVIILYIHWGDEYKLKPNNYQKTIAKRVADLGVDVIIGGHPHVIEPIEIINSEVTGKQTVCVYSMGNTVSNQRIQFMSMKTGHTEDGLIFETTFIKNPDDSIVLDHIGVVPIWVNMHTDTSKHYHILPLDKSVDWQSTFGIDAQTVATAQKSYDRTMELMNAGLSQFDNEYRKQDLNKQKVSQSAPSSVTQ